MTPAASRCRTLQFSAFHFCLSLLPLHAFQVLGQLQLGLEAANQRVMFGRIPSCDVHLEHMSVSRHHATLTLDPAGHLFLTDLGAGGKFCPTRSS